MRDTYKVIDWSGEIATVLGTTNGGKNLLYPLTGTDQFGFLVEYSKTENFRIAPEGSTVVSEMKQLASECVSIDEQIEALKKREREINTRLHELHQQLPAVSEHVPQLGSRLTADQAAAIPEVKKFVYARRRGFSADTAKNEFFETRRPVRLPQAKGGAQ